MHIALLTALIVAGAGQPVYGPSDQPTMVASEPGFGPECAGCQEGCSEDVGHAKPVRKCLADWFGPMPQTCYQPRFGCYPGNGRDIQRYPAFHGYYYRSPYNYRHYFDYPWHAMPHEPQGYYSTAASVIENGPVPTPDPGMSPPVPTPAPMPAPAPLPPGDNQAKANPYAQPRLLRQ